MITHRMEVLLGGTDVIGREIHSEMDLYELVQAGVPKRSVLLLARGVGLSLRTLAQLLHVAERTIQRKRDLDRMNASISEGVIRIAEVFARGDEVFDEPAHFQTWMNTENRALGMRRPIELLSSHYGVQMVLDELGRFEHGVLA